MSLNRVVKKHDGLIIDHPPGTRRTKEIILQFKNELSAKSAVKDLKGYKVTKKPSRGTDTSWYMRVVKEDVSDIVERIRNFREDEEEIIPLEELDEATKTSAKEAAGLLAFVAKNPKRDTSDEDLKTVREFLSLASKSAIAAFLTFFWKNML